LQGIEQDFAERCKSSVKDLVLPSSGAAIDFSNVEFERDAFFQGYLFSRKVLCFNAVFSGGAYFDRATFLSDTFFCRTAFSIGALLATWPSPVAFSSSAQPSLAVPVLAGRTFSAVFSSIARSSAGMLFFTTRPPPQLASSTQFSPDRPTLGKPACLPSPVFKVRGLRTWPTSAARPSPATLVLTARISPARPPFAARPFSGGAFFDGAVFLSSAEFRPQKISQKTYFTRFGGTASFVNAVMKGETSFEEAIFTSILRRQASSVHCLARHQMASATER